jgi:hypothetical protein
VPSARLSDLDVPIDFLKIDVEGGEYNILIGDAALLKRGIKTIVVEADRNPRDGVHKFADLLSSLSANRYKVREVRGGEYPLLLATRHS